MYELVVAINIVWALDLSEILWKAHVEAHTEADARPHVDSSKILWNSSCKASCQKQQNIAVELLYHS